MYTENTSDAWHIPRYPTRKYCITSIYCIVLYCIVLYCIVLYCIVLYCIVLYCIVLYCAVLYCIVRLETGGPFQDKGDVRCHTRLGLGLKFTNEPAEFQMSTIWNVKAL